MSRPIRARPSRRTCGEDLGIDPDDLPSPRTAAFLATGMAFAVGHLIGGHLT